MAKTGLKLFIDANVFIAGSASPAGGSSYILKACQKGVFQSITTRLILQEAKKNIIKKLDEKALNRFIKLIKTLSLKIHPPVTTSDDYLNIIETKDAHVLAAAIESQSDYLITLDRNHFFTDKIKRAKLPIKIITPKNFIRNKCRA